MRLKKEAEIERCRIDAEAWASEFTDRDLTMFALGLYAGEGSETSGELAMANTNERYLRIFMRWIRQTFDIDEQRLRAIIYLHEGLDLDAATRHSSDAPDIPPSQFTKPYRAVPDDSIRSHKHVDGCATARYSSTLLHRRVMAMIDAVSCRLANPG